jgi:hypothetical protein
MPRRRYDPSPDRQKLSRLKKELDGILEVFCSQDPILRGRVEHLRRSCGKPGCRCQRGHLHESIVLIDRSDGTRKTRKLQRGEIGKLRRRTARYRAVKKGRARLSALLAEMLECCDRLLEYRLDTGKRMRS